MFRIKYRDQDDKKTYAIHCKNSDLDLQSHPYFVFVHRVTQPTHSPILLIDNKEMQRFKDTKSLMIPVQSVLLIEEIEDEKPRVSSLPKISSPKSSPKIDKSKNPCKKNPSQ